MICTNCGAEFEGKFCPSCGTRAVVDAPVAEAPVAPPIPAEPQVQAPVEPQPEIPAQPQPQAPVMPQFQMPVQPPVQAQPAFNSVQTFTPADTAKKPVYKKWWFWTLIGVGALALIFVILMVIGAIVSQPDTPPVTVVDDTTQAQIINPEGETVNMDETIEPQEALETAKDLLDYAAFSYKGLIEWLEKYEDFCHADAVYAANNCGANWTQEALRQAKECLNDDFGYSYESLLEYLQDIEQFTYSQAKYAADNSNANWKYQAVVSAKSYLDSLNFSYESLLDQLEFDGFSREEAKYGVDNCGADWNEQAVLMAKDYLSYEGYTRSELIEALEYEGFTHAQAVYGADANNVMQ